MINGDMFRLRSFLAALAAAGELERVGEQVDLIDVAARLDGNPRAVLFSRVGPEGAELVGNVMGSRKRLALALGVAENEVVAEVLNRIAAPVAPLEVPAADAPVQEVTHKGDDLDLTTLPVHLQHSVDGAPYISASLDFSSKQAPDTFNVGCRRLMLLGPRETGIDLNAPSDLRVRFEAARAEGARLPIAFAVGSHPLDYLAATMHSGPDDELATLGGLRGQPLPVVAAVSQPGLLVPADAEFVIEGYLDGAETLQPEGPYGEYLGYAGEPKLNPVFHVTALTRRYDALFQTATISGRHLSGTDTAQLVALATEVDVWEALRGAVSQPVAVHAPPAAGGMHNVRVSLRQRYPGEARNAIAAAFACKADVKNVFVVDDDIDVMSDSQLEWALATRFRPAEDIVVSSGLRAVPIDPSLNGQRTGGKAGFDLTRPFGEGEARRWQTAQPPTAATGQEARAGAVLDALRGGPLSFLDLVNASGSRDGREIARELGLARSAGHVLLNEDGLYVRA